jgi:hypothetical protein
VRESELTPAKPWVDNSAQRSHVVARRGGDNVMVEIVRGWSPRASKGCLISRMLAVLLASAWAFAPQVRAKPVVYELSIDSQNPQDPSNPGPTGSLGSTPFSNAQVHFTFRGYTTDVIPFSNPTGFEILTGTATVIIRDPTSGNLLGQGTFLPSAGIFVSVDNTNGGLGFGSFGLLPTDPNFPGQVTYPTGFIPYPLTPTSSIGYYDLRSYFSSGGHALSCVNFPSPCGAPIALPTTSGDLIIQMGTPAAVFTGQSYSPIMPVITQLLLQ